MLSFFPEFEDYETGPDEYLKLLRRATEALDIPVSGVAPPRLAVCVFSVNTIRLPISHAS